jgi:hypothetical protein
MKLIAYLFISAAATVLIYVLFAASTELPNVGEWNNSAKGFFLLVVALVDLFLINTYAKNKNQ